MDLQIVPEVYKFISGKAEPAGDQGSSLIVACRETKCYAVTELPYSISQKFASWHDQLAVGWP